MTVKLLQPAGTADLMLNSCGDRTHDPSLKPAVSPLERLVSCVESE